jgi:hypothetical protein
MVEMRSNQLAEALLVQRRPAVVLGEHALQGKVVALDGDHGVVDELADGRLLGVGLDVVPAGHLRHPEDTLCGVLVARLRVGALGLLRLQLGVQLLEGVGDVLEEHEP